MTLDPTSINVRDCFPVARYAGEFPKRNDTHQLKTWPQYFEAVRTKLKTFEVRKNDRDFQVGDVLFLNEWDPATGHYTGRSVTRVITYISCFGQPNGQVVMGIR